MSNTENSNNSTKETAMNYESYFSDTQKTVKDKSVVTLDAQPNRFLVLRTGGKTESCPGYPGCDFGMALSVGSVGVNVKITGRTVQKRGKCFVQRVQVEFVGDCEPSTFASGWLYVQDLNGIVINA